MSEYKNFILEQDSQVNISDIRKCLLELLERESRENKECIVALDCLSTQTKNKTNEYFSVLGKPSRDFQGELEKHNKTMNTIHYLLSVIDTFSCNVEMEDVRFKVLEALEMDRKRIARDLHDSTVQLLTMLVHKAELCEKLVDIDSIRTKIELNMMMQALKDTVNELRTTIYNLRPMSIDDLGLVATVERYILLLKQHGNINIFLEVENEEYDCKSVVKLSIYRIIQEACSNIIKHAKATSAKVKITFCKNCINVVIEDNGVGIKDFEQIQFQSLCKKNTRMDELSEKCNLLNGYGLSMLYERVYLLFGTISIDSNEKGTIISVSVPVLSDEEDSNETD